MQRQIDFVLKITFTALITLSIANHVCKTYFRNHLRCTWFVVYNIKLFCYSVSSGVIIFAKNKLCSKLATLMCFVLICSLF